MAIETEIEIGGVATGVETVAELFETNYDIQLAEVVEGLSQGVEEEVLTGEIIVEPAHLCARCDPRYINS